MKLHRIFSLFLLVLVSFAVSAQTAAGDWSGRLDIGQAVLTLTFHFTFQGDRYAGSMDSPDQGVYGLEADSVVTDGHRLSVHIAKAGIRYEATLEGDSILRGTFIQGPARLPLDLRQTDLFAMRPQTPRPPFPYRSEEVSITNPQDGVTLAGTLTLPAGGKPSRAVILLTGSGTQDRDETLFHHRPFLVLADYLTRQGIAVLRCDDRGAGHSTGNPSTATTETGASDAACMLAYLKTRPEIDSTRIGLLGHSEGGAIAFLTAARCPEVYFIVSMAGPGVRGDSILLRQNMVMARLKGLPGSEMDSLRQTLCRIYALAESELSDEEVTEQVARLYEQLKENSPLTDARRQELRRQAAVFASPWMRCFLRFDPQPFISSASCHVLALNGDHDTQVDAATNLNGICQALRKKPGRRVTVKCYPELNHLFQHCTTGLFTEYGQIRETINPEVLVDIAAWVNALP